ncbi:MAG: hypothetical protein ACREP1_09665, partial [Rhodanobacteraceae bacterium]
MKDSPRENFRWAAHTGGLAIVKSKDYDLDGEVDAVTPYAAWKALLAEERALRPGDLLELTGPEGEPGQLEIAKYIGFDPAKWYVPEVKPDSIGASAAAETDAPAHPL